MNLSTPFATWQIKLLLLLLQVHVQSEFATLYHQSDPVSIAASVTGNQTESGHPNVPAIS